MLTSVIIPAPDRGMKRVAEKYKTYTGVEVCNFPFHARELCCPPLQANDNPGTQCPCVKWSSWVAGPQVCNLKAI